MTQQRTPISEVVGDAPTAFTAEQLATMTTDQQQVAANDFWLATVPPPGPAPTTQAVKTLSDLLGPG